MTQRLLIILGLLCLFSHVQAQDDLLPVLHAEDIFAEGVTVLERLPVINYDNEARSIYYFDPDEMVWETYEFPNSIVWIDEIQELDDGLYYIFAPISEWSLPYTADSTWIFNLLTGEFSRSESICDGWYSNYAPPAWRIMRRQGESQLRLCHTGTHAISPVLPDKIQDGYDGIPSCAELLPKQEPDSNWVIIPCGTVEEGYTVYAFNTITEDYHGIGSIQNYPQIYYYIDEQTPLIYSGDSNFVQIYVADITTPNSLSLVAEQTGFPQFVDSPPRLIYGNEQVFITNFLIDETELIYDYNCEQDCSIRQVYPNTYPTQYWLDLSGSPAPRNVRVLSIIEADTAEVLYRDAATEAKWLDENTMLYVQPIASDFSNYRINVVDIEPELQVFTIEQTITNYEFYDLLWDVSADKHYLILLDGQNSYIYNLQHNLLYPLTQISASLEDIRIYISWNDNNTLEVRIRNTVPYGFMNIARWHIEMDAISELDT